MTVTRRRIIVLILALVLVAAVGGVGAFAALQSSRSRPDPAGVVTEYLAALADGDAEAARRIDGAALTADNAPTLTWARDLLDGRALAEAESRVGPAEVVATTVSPEAAQVRAAFEFDGEQVEQVFQLTWADAAWRLDTTLVGCVSASWTVDDLSGPLGFRLGDVVAGDGTRQYAVDPAVYGFAPEVDPALLADPAAVPVRVSIAPNGGCIDVEVELLEPPR